MNLRTNLQKAAYHLAQAELRQAEIEALETEAAANAAVQQLGRMQPSDESLIDHTYIQKTLLDTHKYKRLCGIRDAHQKQAQMYTLAHLANIPATGNAIMADGKVGLPVKPA